MKLTKEQISEVKTEVEFFLQEQLGMGCGDADNMSDSLLADIVTDIEETADWSDLEPDMVCLGDVYIAIGRVVTKRLNKNKVFVLVTQWSVDFEQDVKCEAYATKELAQEAMRHDYEYMCDEYPDWVGSIGDDCAELQEEGDYTRNHCDWQIKGLDVTSE